MLEVLDYAIKFVPVAPPDAAPKLAQRRRLKLIKKETCSLSVKERVLDIWQDLQNIDLQMDVESHYPENITDGQVMEHQGHEDDPVEVIGDKLVVTSQIEEKEVTLEQDRGDSAEPISPEHGENHDIAHKQPRVRPSCLRPHLRIRNYGLHFVTGKLAGRCAGCPICLVKVYVN